MVSSGLVSSVLVALLLFAPPEDGGSAPVAGPDPDGELEVNPEWDEPDEPEQPAPPPAVVAPPPAAAPPAAVAPTPAPAPAPAQPQPQRPAAQQPNATPATSTAAPAEKNWDGQPRSEEDAQAAEEKEKKEGRFGGLKLFRIAFWPKIGYTHGTSDKNGIFDREKSIEASVENMEATMTGAGDLGKTQFGGPMYGFEVDIEVFFINAWLDFHKFFRPGGMWSLLIGYDHEFRLHDRVRFNLGAGFGMMRVFLGSALEDLYYDKDNPMAVNIATAGIEGRVLAGFDFRLAGPLYTGPQFMGGYHYLWSANVDEVTKEKGFHYSAAWNLKLQFEFPRDW